MPQLVQLKAAIDHFEFGALHAQAEGERRGGVVVIQEIFGIDSYVEADVVRWSQLGFEVLAPSLFDRVERGYVAGHDADGFTRGIAARSKISLATALSDIAACLAFLRPRGPVFVVGYCYGGFLSWHAAGQLDGFAAASAYYGGGLADAAGIKPKCPVICHFGRKDTHIPADEVKARIQAAQPQVPVYIYENSGHGFNNDGRPDSNAADAQLARRRTLELFESAI